MHRDKPPSFDLFDCSLGTVRSLCEQFHVYQTAGNVAVYAFDVREHGRSVAAYAWQPPPPGAAASVCPEAPFAVLGLSRMVAVPREERELNHVGKPLRWQMKNCIDRTRWPVLVTYSDEGAGHNGHVYKASGWTPTSREKRRVYVTEDGGRASSYSNGKTGGRRLTSAGHTWIQRWEHWIVPFDFESPHWYPLRLDATKAERDMVTAKEPERLAAIADARKKAGPIAAKWVSSHGWVREPIPGKVWRSGSQAFRWVKVVAA